MNLEERIVNLETTIAFQEQKISDLNEVILEQLKRIEALERLTLHLKSQMEIAAEIGMPSPPANEKPPHY